MQAMRLPSPKMIPRQLFCFMKRMCLKPDIPMSQQDNMQWHRLELSWLVCSEFSTECCLKHTLWLTYKRSKTVIRVFLTVTFLFMNIWDMTVKYTEGKGP